MTIKLNRRDIMGIIGAVLLGVFVGAVIVTIMNNFAWSESLGLYYTGHYITTLGDMARGVEPMYVETHLNVFEVIIKAVKLWF